MKTDEFNLTITVIHKFLSRIVVLLDKIVISNYISSTLALERLMFDSFYDYGLLTTSRTSRRLVILGLFWRKSFVNWIEPFFAVAKEIFLIESNGAYCLSH